MVPEALFWVDGYFAPGLLRHSCDSWQAQIHGRGGIWNSTPHENITVVNVKIVLGGGKLSSTVSDLRLSCEIWCHGQQNRRRTRAEPWAVWTRETHDPASLPEDSGATKNKERSFSNWSITKLGMGTLCSVMKHQATGPQMISRPLAKNNHKFIKVSSLVYIIIFM